MQAWIEHARGAAALVEVRGVEQLHRESGFHMFHSLRNEIVCDM